MSDEKKTLENDEITSERMLGRRSTLGLIGASVVGAAALTVGGSLAASRASAQTDSDSGPNADPAGGGRTGATDSDRGPNADRGGHGHVTDSDSGPNADRGGAGRGRHCSDSDGGRNADPANNGRHC